LIFRIATYFLETEFEAGAGVQAVAEGVAYEVEA
jgi:hypothetical protein